MARARSGPSLLDRLALTAIPGWLLALYRRPLAFLAGALVLPLVGVCTWLYVANERQWRMQESHDLLLAARLASRIIQEEFTRTHETEAALAAQRPFLDALRRHKAAPVADSLNLLLQISPMIETARVVDADGQVLAEQSRETAEPGAEPSAGVAAPTVSGVSLRDPASGEKVVEMSAPIVDGTSAVGSLQLRYRLQALSRWLQKIRVEPAGHIYVVDQHGLLAVHPLQILPGKPKDVSRWAPVAAPASAEGTLVRFSMGTPSRPWTAAVVAVEPFGWRVVAQQPDEAMLRPFRRLVGVFVGVIAVLALLLSALILRWASIHRATLELLAQQSKLLRQSEQDRLRQASRRPKRPKDGDNA